MILKRAEIIILRQGEILNTGLRNNNELEPIHNRRYFLFSESREKEGKALKRNPSATGNAHIARLLTLLAMRIVSDQHNKLPMACCE